MDKVIVTVMLIIGGLVASFAVFNSVYPAAERSGQAVSEAVSAVNDRITSRIEIIQACTDGTTVDAWVKNVGTSQIGSIEYSDVFFGVAGGISRISFGNESSPLPYWSYQLEGNGNNWRQTVTNKITVHLEEALTPGIYLFKIVIPNGISSETSFSLE